MHFTLHSSTAVWTPLERSFFGGGFVFSFINEIHGLLESALFVLITMYI